MFLDYEVLRVIWWLLLGVLFIGFAVMDGFDFGALMLLPIIGKNDVERRIIINTVGPVWEGNQVWFILSGGAIFATWPYVYATVFSGFYAAMFIILSVLILRPVGFKYRSKIESLRWRYTWDSILSLVGFVAALICGVAVGNLLQGVDYNFDSDLRLNYTGNFFGLLNPFGLLTGIMGIFLLMMQGSVYLALKAENPVQDRAANITKIAIIITMVLYIIGGICLFFINGYKITSDIDVAGPSNPTYKVVELVSGGWIDSIMLRPWVFIAPLIAMVAAIFAYRFTDRKQFGYGFIATSFVIFGVISSVGLTMFPFILPSTLNPSHSLIVWDSSSSQYTLMVSTIVSVIFVPIVLAYTSWVYSVFRGKVTAAQINKDEEF